MRTMKWLCLTLAILAVSACIAVPLGNYLLYSRCIFEPNRWQPGDVRQRERMVLDLCQSNVLIGKSQVEVSAILGPPDRRRNRAWEYDFVHGDLLRDTLNLPFSGWREWLQVEFDATTDRVRKVSRYD